MARYKRLEEVPCLVGCSLRQTMVPRHSEGEEALCCLCEGKMDAVTAKTSQDLESEELEMELTPFVNREKFASLSGSDFKITSNQKGFQTPAQDPPIWIYLYPFWPCLPSSSGVQRELRTQAEAPRHLTPSPNSSQFLMTKSSAFGPQLFLLRVHNQITSAKALEIVYSRCSATFTVCPIAPKSIPCSNSLLL